MFNRMPYVLRTLENALINNISVESNIFCSKRKQTQTYGNALTNDGNLI